MARVLTSADDGPVAFNIKLSINTGRYSPECDPKDIRVNAETTVHYIFVQGAYLLRDVHGRDHSQLQKDFDLYLLRPGRDDIGLNASREISDYGIQKDDELQLRHKTMPIPIAINLSLGDDRKIEVNSGFPIMDIVPTICEQFGIKHHAELSLALVRSDHSSSKMQLQWLDKTSSLNGQGVTNGDQLVLRKKFFILNDDIREAIDGNQVLMDLLYQQIYQHYLTENFVGNDKENDGHCAKVSAFIHHIEQEDESISDDDALSKVVPLNRQNNSSFYSEIVATYYHNRIGTLDKKDARIKLLRLFLEGQSTVTNYYPVKTSEESEESILVVDSDSVTVCQQEKIGELQPMKGMKWRLRDDLRGTDCSSQKDEFLRVNVLGTWKEFYTNQRVELARYLVEAHKLMKNKVLRGRQSTILDNWSSLAKTAEGIENEPEEEDRMEEQKEDEEETFEWPKNEDEEIEKHESERIPDLTPFEDSRQARSASPGKRPINIISSKEMTPPAASGRDAKEASPTKSVSGTSTSSVIYIPDFLEKDYRQVLNDYKLFHIIVMKQDVRPVLLNIHRTVSELVEGVCGTFGIPNPNEYYFWIPNGIQAIIEKYGGKPKKRIGKFRKTQQHAKDFAPRLDGNKSLDEQYNMTIKPYVLHLRKYLPEGTDETDAPDESTLDSGEEWPQWENQDVANYRRFYQGWTGVVQGAYPIEKKGAVKLAALLTQIYFGERSKARVWPPLDYDVKNFLPEKHCSSLGISSEVEKEHRELGSRSAKECIDDVIDGCQKMITFHGVFFEVAVPVKSEILAVIPWNKMEQQILGINQNGIISINRDTGKILFVRRFWDIFNWTSAENSFQLNFKGLAENYNAYTYQTKEILETLKLYIQMIVKGKIEQPPSKPSSISIETPPPSKADSPAPSSPTYKSPINANAERNSTRLSSSSPTTYDL